MSDLKNNWIEKLNRNQNIYINNQRMNQKNEALTLSARWHFLNRLTLLTFNRTTPQELALALVSHSYQFCLVWPSAAQLITAINTAGVLIANATPGTTRTQSNIRLAEIRTTIQENQVGFLELIEQLIFGHKSNSAVSPQLPSDAHLSSCIEFFFQLVTNQVKWWHSSPACLYFTWPWHPVAFTLSYHILFDHLLR